MQHSNEKEKERGRFVEGLGLALKKEPYNKNSVWEILSSRKMQDALIVKRRSRPIYLRFSMIF